MPSRHYHNPDPKRPLSGARVALGDTLDAEGARTTLGSRAWAALYPAAGASVSAQYVRELLGLGAVVVGKTRVAQFRTGEEWVDFRGPASLRGDGYQAAGAGVGAALAGYGWIDYAVGGDGEFTRPLGGCCAVVLIVLLLTDRPWVV